MPIKQFHNRALRTGNMLPEIGRWRKGDVKLEKGYAPELPHFRFSPTPHPLFNQAALEAAISAIYGDSPTVLSNVQFMSDDPDTVFNSSYEQWAENKHGKSQIMRRCDGETITLQWAKQGEKSVCIRTPTPCTHQCECKATGRLSFWLPDFTMQTGVAGSFVLVTHSKEDIETITEVVKQTHLMAGRLTGLPFTLYRIPKDVVTPLGVTSLKYPVKLTWESATAEYAALNAGQQLPALPAKTEPIVIEPEQQWTEAEALSFSQYWQSRGYSSDQIKRSLGVNRLGEWQHSKAAAMARMENHQ